LNHQLRQKKPSLSRLNQQTRKPRDRPPLGCRQAFSENKFFVKYKVVTLYALAERLTGRGAP
jgi:hypothetical protein